MEKGTLVEEVGMEMKGGTDRIHEMVERQTEALVFVLEHGGYWGPAIREYYDQLLGHSFLRYVIVNHPDGRLFGVYDAKKLNGFFRERAARMEGPPEERNWESYQGFAELLNSGDGRARESLSRLPGFIGSDMAVDSKTTKREALENMEESDIGVLPVVRDDGHFAGIVEQSRLVASLIIDVSKTLESTN